MSFHQSADVFSFDLDMKVDHVSGELEKERAHLKIMQEDFSKKELLLTEEIARMKSQIAELLRQNSTSSSSKTNILPSGSSSKPAAAIPGSQPSTKSSRLSSSALVPRISKIRHSIEALLAQSTGKNDSQEKSPFKPCDEYTGLFSAYDACKKSQDFIREIHAICFIHYDDLETCWDEQFGALELVVTDKISEFCDFRRFCNVLRKLGYKQDLNLTWKSVSFNSQFTKSKFLKEDRDKMAKNTMPGIPYAEKTR
jgi:uncharacterized small protein (DUF1192 family)